MIRFRLFFGDLIGGFRCAQRKILAYRRLYFSEPVVFFIIPDKLTTKKATLLGGIVVSHNQPKSNLL